MSIMPPLHETMAHLELAALRDENARLRAALAYYAKPRAYGRGEHSVFVDDSGVAKAALGDRLCVASEGQGG